MPIQYEEAVTRFFFGCKILCPNTDKNVSRNQLYHTRCQKPGCCCHFTADTEFSFSDYIIFIIIILFLTNYFLQHFSLLDLCVTDNNRVHKSYLSHSSVSKQQPNHFSKIIKIENHMCIGMFCYYWLCLRDFFRKQKSKYSSPTHTLRGFEHVLRKVWKCGKI